MRAPISITAFKDPDTLSETLYAVCDDGSTWTLGGDNNWTLGWQYLGCIPGTKDAVKHDGCPEGE
jgi:hypothetical protein